MLSTDLDGTNGFSITGPSEAAYAGIAVAGAGVRNKSADEKGGKEGSTRGRSVWGVIESLNHRTY